VRDLAELLSVDDEGWLSFETWAAASSRSVSVLPTSEQHRTDCLRRLQVTTRSVLGALAWHTGGVLLDHGWLRLLGGVSSAGLPDVATASGMAAVGKPGEAPPHLVIAYDVLGGTFAVNGEGLPCDMGEVAYFAPDTLTWQGLGQGNRDFVNWALTGDLTGFYASLRWPGWESEAESLPLTCGLAVFPPLFSREALADLGATSRAAVPWGELVGAQEAMAEQLRDVPDGGQFRVSVEPSAKRRWRRR
jgi:hypothetical protein